MSNFLKYKLATISLSLTILALIPLFSSSFNAPNKWEKWRALTWDDFRGVAKPFSKWGATIQSNVFVEYDSVENQYKAYSAMNQNHSWKSRPRYLSDYLLNHEQYHFNITEYFSRKMNWLIEKQDFSDDDISGLLSEIRRDERHLQKEYDDESAHGLNWGVQRYWEFRIDSLLSSSQECCGKLEEGLGIKIYLPYTDTKNSKWKNGTDDMDMYWLEKYDMMLSFSIIKSETISNIDKPEDSDGMEIYNYDWDSLAVLSVKDDTLAFSKRVTAVDTLDYKIIEDLWIKEEGRMYRLSAEYPNRANHQKGFLRIVNSYFNSFELLEE
ncbi:hypothetical protein FKX85_01595 [Echinicola soli]|uniref:DUF922 domain-containing protein n=1 Tax=Echinicola soli TaxID=2591634 RepID=A0A514CDB6_9BACT|nr:hypothetical protein [Echinicola soli]QDH77807.1 hypothetical protein FKX85_01595 [Echinicola soli]